MDARIAQATGDDGRKQQEEEEVVVAVEEAEEAEEDAREHFHAAEDRGEDKEARRRHQGWQTPTCTSSSWTQSCSCTAFEFWVTWWN